MITPILATGDPYEAKQEFLESGWDLVFETPRDSNDNLVCIKIENAQVMLGRDTSEFIRVEAKRFRGAGVDFYIELETEGALKNIFVNHKTARTAIEELSRRDWGVMAFRTKICGYSFLFASKQ